MRSQSIWHDFRSNFLAAAFISFITGAGAAIMPLRGFQLLQTLAQQPKRCSAHYRYFIDAINYHYWHYWFISRFAAGSLEPDYTMTAFILRLPRRTQPATFDARLTWRLLIVKILLYYYRFVEVINFDLYFILAPPFIGAYHIFSFIYYHTVILIIPHYLAQPSLHALIAQPSGDIL